METFLKNMRNRDRERRAENERAQREIDRIEKEAAQRHGVHHQAASTWQPNRRDPKKIEQIEQMIALQRNTTGKLPPAGEMPDGWRARLAPNGSFYYVNLHSGQSQWERPSNTAAQQEWQLGYNAEGVPYYYNAVKGITQWERPSEWPGQSFVANEVSISMDAPTSAQMDDPRRDERTGLGQCISVSQNDDAGEKDGETGFGEWETVGESLGDDNVGGMSKGRPEVEKLTLSKRDRPVESSWAIRNVDDVECDSNQRVIAEHAQNTFPIPEEIRLESVTARSDQQVQAATETCFKKRRGTSNKSFRRKG